PAPPRLELPTASFEPLMESVSAIATAVATKASPPVQAPGTTGAGVSGIVLDPTGALVPEVIVTLTPSNGQEAKTATTNGQGAYTFSQIVPGEWTLRAKVPDFTAS